jgi:cell division protein FtsQ
MASTRKPTFKPANDTAKGAARPSTDPDPRSNAAPGDVISAERIVEPGQVPGRKGAGSKLAAAKAAAARKPKTGRPPAGQSAPDDNVIAFPEPKRHRTRRYILWTAAVTAAVVAAIIAGAVFSPALAVRAITVDGTKLLTVDAVQEALAPMEGKPLPQVTEQDVNDLLKPLVQVRSATIEARPPSELLVHVEERVPVALLKQGDSFVMVDVDGVQLGATADQSAVALPLIDAGAGAGNTQLFKAIAAVLDTLPADVLARMSAASAASPDAVELKLVDGKTVVWGNAEDRELKAKALEALLKMPADPKVPVNVYDVSVPRHPFTR